MESRKIEKNKVFIDPDKIISSRNPSKIANIFDLRNLGYTYEDIGYVLGISRQRASFAINTYKTDLPQLKLGNIPKYEQ